MNTDRLSGFNPLRGLTLDGLVNLLEMGERGYYADLMWLYRLVMRRNGPARAVRRKLTSAITRLDWNIKIPDKLEGERKEKALRQQAALRTAVDSLKNFRETLRHLAFADIMGFSHVEKIYVREGADKWAVKELRVVPQWYMCRDGVFKPWAYNADATNINRGVPIDKRHWIIREVEDPAAEIFTFAHLKMSNTDADWDQFCDTYAVNPIFIEMPPNVPRDDVAYYQDTAERVVSDGRGALPNGAKPHVVSPGGAGESVFTERLRYFREEIVIAGTGGILTTLDGNTGIGKGPSEEHGDAWLDIAAEIGGGVSECIQDQFCVPTIERLFPGEEILAYFELDKPEHSLAPGAVLDDAKKAKDAGLYIDAEELSEKTGYTLREIQTAATKTIPTNEKTPGDASAAPAAAPALPKPEAARPPEEKPPVAQSESPKQSAAGEPKQSLVQAALANDLDLESRWLAPVADVLSEIESMLRDESIPLEKVAEKIEAAAKAMPDLLGKLNVEALARALESAAGPATVEGLSDGLRAKAKRPAEQTA